MILTAGAIGQPNRSIQVGNTDRLRRKLLWRIQQRYQTRTAQTSIGPLHFSFTRIADPDRVLDEVADAEDRRERRTGQRTPSEQLHLPYWAELWDSAAGIGQHLSSSPLFDVGCSMLDVRCSIPPSNIGNANIEHPTSNIQHRTRNRPEVLDLGCGMGLSGTVAAALGAQVTFADLESAALLFARLNTLPWRRHVRTRRLDWRTDSIGRRFHRILGADILYERQQWDFLEPFWRAHLSPDGEVMLGEPGRQTGDSFIQWIQERGWMLEQKFEKVATREKPIRIFVLRRVSFTASPTSFPTPTRTPTLTRSSFEQDE